MFMLAAELLVQDHLRISQNFFKKIVTKRVDLESDSIRKKKKKKTLEFGLRSKKTIK